MSNDSPMMSTVMYAGPPPLSTGDPFDVPDLAPFVPPPAYVPVGDDAWRAALARLQPVTAGDVQHAIDEAMRSPAVIAAALMRLSSSGRDTVRVLLDALEADGARGDPDQRQIVRAIIEFVDGARQTVEITRPEPQSGEARP